MSGKYLEVLTQEVLDRVVYAEGIDQGSIVRSIWTIINKVIKHTYDA